MVDTPKFVLDMLLAVLHREFVVELGSFGIG
jgi:hypothetical protein